MTEFLVTTTVNASQVLVDNEVGIVAAGGALTGGVRIEPIMGPAVLVVLGSITGGVRFEGGPGDAIVRVGPGGALDAFASYGTEGTISLRNAGRIDGDQVAVIALSCSELSIVNTGFMTTTTGGLLTFPEQVRSATIKVGSGHVQVTNTGVIAGPDNAILADGADVTSIFNSGRISARVAIDLGDMADRVVNAGVIRGEVNLGDGRDLFDGRLGRQTAWVNGEGGNDVLLGGRNDDTLSGGAGDDILRGRAGDDELRGGRGADTFVFRMNQGTDRVLFFENDRDTLDLRTMGFAQVAAVRAVSTAVDQGLRIDVPGEGVIFVSGLTLATLSAGDVLL